MNRQNALRYLLHSHCFFVSHSPAMPKEKPKHVVLIGLDGWGAYSLPKADMPNVKKLMEDGAYTLKKRSALPSSSAINWASMLWEPVPNFTDTPNGDLKLGTSVTCF